MSDPVVVWWTIDSLRQDICSVYEGEARTPVLSQLAEQGKSYNARSMATWTLPSVTSILTGEQPEKHGVETQDDRLQPGTPTLPQYFRNQGWNTLGIVANPWFSRRKGLDIGFDQFYNITEDGSLIKEVSRASVVKHLLNYRTRGGGLSLDVDNHPSEPLIVDLAREWLREAEQPTFIMVHTQGAHSPYNSPNTWNRHQDETEPLRADYLNLVEFIDAQLGRFIDTLPSNATIIVTSDHGEALGESGEWGHKNEELDFLHDVPAIIAGSTPNLTNNIDHIDIHDWLREDIIPAHGNQVRSNDLEEQLEALGYVDGRHSV
ncbi:sulfatase-like hydrolase/transferase [Halorubrum sp. SP9]|uniref:sulfatase-like hydrolase/transferase n=1 Tax=Halorubrum sp. SP9 TaxID=1537267 RepID=UPI0010F4F0D3|nr:sulfatase-like hydrolase/transferase [Halorubrum sp. SP9]TKX66494.1 hypothetical protein EXE45_15325 [Halorubrum sp. SP9]